MMRYHISKMRDMCEQDVVERFLCKVNQLSWTLHMKQIHEEMNLRTYFRSFLSTCPGRFPSPVTRPGVRLFWKGRDGC